MSDKLIDMIGIALAYIGTFILTIKYILEIK